MKLYESCISSESDCATSGRFSIAYLESNVKPKNLHIHNNLEVYYSLSKGQHFIIDGTIYPVQERNVFIINQYEAHRIDPIEGHPHNRYILSIMPEFLKSLSSSSTDLLDLFYNKNEFLTCISLSETQHNKVMGLIDKLIKVQGFGADLIENGILTEMILLFINISKSTVVDVPEPDNKHVSEILNYIDQSLDNDLSLETISAQFYLSKGYLCRLFKKHTCTTINDYICSRRIAKAKQLLESGYTVQETIAMTGFNDYANFIRRFKEKVGTTPKKYAKKNTTTTAQ